MTKSLGKVKHEMHDLLQHVYSACMLLNDLPDGPQKDIVAHLLTRARIAKQKFTDLFNEIMPMKTPSLNVIVVEDDPTSRNYLCKIISEAGHTISGTFDTGEEMVEIVTSLDLDMLLIVFDISLPGISGLEALEEIKKHKLVPAVAVTGHDDAEMVHKAMDNFALGYLVKPVEPSELLVAISVAYRSFQEIESLQSKSGILSHALEKYKVVNRAKTNLQRRKGISEEDAHRFLQKRAMDDKKKIEDIAKEVLAGRI
jgi:two-component system, response regulator PdtaR